MAIDILSNRSMNGLQETVANAKTKAQAGTAGKAPAGTAPAASVGTDAVMLTDSARTLARATEKARAADGIDSGKVEKLKKSIADGSYKVNYQSVASRLIESEDELSTIFG